MDRIKNIYRRGQNRLQPVGRFIERKPYTSFFLALAFLLIIMILATTLGSQSKTQTNQSPSAKDVQVYHLGQTPMITSQGVVEKSGVAKIVSQTAGIVSAINVSIGGSVQKGAILLTLSSNYQGGNAPAMQAQIANAQYQNVVQTYDEQKNIINTQRTIANQTNANTLDLQQITQKAQNDTRGLLDQTRLNLTAIATQIQSLQQSNVNGGNDQAIAQAQQLQAQLQATASQLQATFNQQDYQTNPTNPPTQLANQQLTLTNQQLDIQSKTLDLTKQTSSLQASLADIQAAAMTPASPFTGTVERINVHVGDSVTPGTVLGTVSANSQASSVIVSLPQALAFQVSKFSESTLHIGNNTISEAPTFISQDATDGLLYTISYAVPDQFSGDVTNGDSITVDVPLTTPDTTSSQASNSGQLTDPVVPLDAVYQTQSNAYVYIVSNHHAKSREVTLGNVYGQFVQVSQGINPTDTLILSRNVVDGEAVSVK